MCPCASWCVWLVTSFTHSHTHTYRERKRETFLTFGVKFFLLFFHLFMRSVHSSEFNCVQLLLQLPGRKFCTHPIVLCDPLFLLSLSTLHLHSHRMHPIWLTLYFKLQKITFRSKSNFILSTKYFLMPVGVTKDFLFFYFAKFPCLSYWDSCESKIKAFTLVSSANA